MPHGTRVTDPGRLREAVRDALGHPGPALIEVIADPLLL
jgi:thiamine pyrophosphate-dependent acetolactate synthase large subunit-like protein